ncbi:MULTISPECIES: hypothetical protein [Paracoccus]|uniref:Uncharacterized protein n=1 Tax=Paracoccus kondratievae TaxID=135740 RepID=A0AAD3P0L0_9RHOB|nr:MULTISPECIES: hypothetical protein [Paracoccus]WJS87405.1 hypothetical protein NBE95_22330 [Paracoccus sp. TOH]GLK65352.1 hypothetical protein GCM10017635_28270 [Paracoccus kondratievae]
MATPITGDFNAGMQDVINQQRAITLEAAKTNVEIAKQTTLKDAYGKIR